MQHTIEKIDQYRLPAVPTRGLVAFPNIALNFEIIRPFSVAALKEAEKTNMLLFLVAQKDLTVENPKPTDCYKTGVIIHVRQSVKTPEGPYRVVADVLSRATASSYAVKENVFYASVLSKNIRLDDPLSDLRCSALVKEVLKETEQLLEYHPNVSRNFISAAHTVSDDPGALADLIASTLLTKVEDKQKILSEYHPVKRMEKLLVCIDEELELLRLESEIQEKVKKQMDQNQRDYYLREQMKTIQDELGQDGDDEIVDYQNKIKKANLPKEVEEKLNKEVSRLAKTSYASPEANVLGNYLDTCLEIPWNVKTKDRLDIKAAAAKLDKDHEGLTKVKERILEYLAVKQLNPELKNQLLCLVGPPGTGKTSLGESIARAMNRNFVRVSLGGIRDEADIRGHRKTYVAAMPGRIITALIQAKSMNPVIMLDEIDKLCQDLHGDPASALLEVMDPEQNKAFRDHFVELPVDLSDCLFIANANTLSTIPRALIDRLEVIELNSYTENEKLSIAKNHLIPKQLKRHGMTSRNLRLPDETIRELIRSYTSEAGVRNLERQIAALARKCAKKRIEEKRDRQT
ncbi:MAG: endopeptidase La, partial [Clostridia bacterium]|nr:endopeptidase La [Clostridia bacterium]